MENTCGRRIALLSFLIALVFSDPAALYGQEKGWIWNMSLYGNTYPTRDLPPDDTGQVPGTIRSQLFRFGNRFGYRVNRHWDLTTELPIYLVSFCQTDLAAAETCGDNNGVGDLGFSLDFRWENPVLNFYSNGTVRLPTGDKALGLSAGTTTASWSNTLNRRFHRTTPFATVTLANSVFQTSGFLRPFASNGFIVELTGGLEHQLHRYLRVGASAYKIIPRGTQTTFGRLTTPTTGPPVNSRVPNLIFAPQQGETTGTSDLTRDNGGSVWARVPVHRNLEFQFAYTRSVRLDLDVISYGVLINLSRLLPRR